MKWNDVAWNRIDEAVDGLEEAWHENAEVDLAEFLPSQEDSQYRDVLVALIKIDQEHRWAAGQPRGLEEYIEQWPELTDNKDAVLELLTAECRICISHSQIPTDQDIERRFPDLAEEIDLAAIQAEVEDRADNEISQLFSRIVESNYGGGTAKVAMELSDGTEIHQYKIIEPLGKGGMGRVYKAHDTILNRSVAIKLLDVASLPRGDERTLLMHDAQAMAKINHPGIVTVYEVGETEQGQPFLVMEYVSGPTLGDKMRSGRLTVDDTVAIVLQVAEALQLAHQRGVIHRDIKPANILMDDEYGARLTDFGLAHREDDPETLSGSIVGTPPYMAPEQYSDQMRQTYGRTDIWSLGVVLYELLSGERPFQGETRNELRKAILHQEPKPLRQRDKGIPAELAAICMKCLMKDPANRYQAAADLAADLRKWQRQNGASRGNRGLLTTLGLAASVLLLVGTAWLMGRGKSTSMVTGDALKDTDGQIADSGRSRVLPPVTEDGVATELDGNIDVKIFNETDPSRRFLSFREPTARPLREDDLIIVEVELNRPAFLYILWIDEKGDVSPVYPWKPGNWNERPSEKPVKRTTLPGDGKGWPMAGSSGMQTIVLLARNDRLPDSVDLRNELGDQPKQTFQNPRSLFWFKNGNLVTEHVDRTRGPQFFNPQQIDDPVYQTQRRIYKNLEHEFPLISANSFAYQASESISEAASEDADTE